VGGKQLLGDVRSSGTTNNHRSDVFEDILERIGHGGSVLYDEDA
jgi:hypothetical protein